MIQAHHPPFQPVNILHSNYPSPWLHHPATMMTLLMLKGSDGIGKRFSGSPFHKAPPAPFNKSFLSRSKFLQKLSILADVTARWRCWMESGSQCASMNMGWTMWNHRDFVSGRSGSRGVSTAALAIEGEVYDNQASTKEATVPNVLLHIGISTP